MNYYKLCATTMVLASCFRAPISDSNDANGSEATDSTESGSEGHEGNSHGSHEDSGFVDSGTTAVDTGTTAVDTGTTAVSSEVSSVGTSTTTSTTTFDPDTGLCQLGDEGFPLDSEIEWPDACTRWTCTEQGPVESWRAPSSIMGDVSVSTPEHIAALACVVDIGGTLLIGGDASDPASLLTSLVGLEQLGYVGALRIVNNPALTSLQGLSGLYEITGALEIRGNANLPVLDGFSVALSALGDVAIVDNDALTSLRGLEFLGDCPTCVPCGVTAQCGDTTGGEGSGGAPAPGGLIFGSLDISDNDVLVDSSAISKLRIVWTDVLVQNNAKLADLAGFASLYEVGGNLSIVENIALLGDLAREAASRMTISGVTTICANMGDPPC